MKNYCVVSADFIELGFTEGADLTRLVSEKIIKTAFVELVKHTTNKSLDGSQMKTQRGIVFKAYKPICEADAVKILGVTYTNLEITEIVGNKQQVLIEAFA